MKLKNHLLISLPLSGAVYLLTRSVYSSLACFCMGVFIDLDHIFDYLLYSNFKFSIRGFFDTCNGYKLKKFYLVLHSYEILILSWALYLVSRNKILLGFNIGYTVHLLVDQFANYSKPLTYFFTFRLLNKFENVFEGRKLSPGFKNLKV